MNSVLSWLVIIFSLFMIISFMITIVCDEETKEKVEAFGDYFFGTVFIILTIYFGFKFYFYLFG